MSLDNNQLLLLDNLIYLDTSVESPNSTVGEVVDKLLTKTLEQDKIYTDAAGKTSDMCLMSKEEWTSVLTAIKNDDELCSLKITKTENNDSTGFRAVCLTDDNQNSTVIFRGTSGNYQWHDNGAGGYEDDTPSQVEALDFINGLDASSITVSGHSKGGNMSQYVTILSDKVDRCVSFDGQGFSDVFVQKYSTCSVN